VVSSADEGKSYPRTVHRNEKRWESYLQSASRTAQDPALYSEKKQRLLELLAIYMRQGHLTMDDVARAVGYPTEFEMPEVTKALRRHVTDLEAEVRHAKATEAFAEAEMTELETSLARERELLQESLARIAHLEAQLQDARRTTVKLTVASRESLKTMKRVRTELVAETFGRDALNPLLHDLQQMAQTVQELHTLALVGEAAGSLQPEGP
jgi:chromosome segregation ATPase